MPNPVRPNGFSPVKSAQGNTWNEQANTYFVPQANTDAIYIGDLVKSLAGGDPNGIPAVQKCASGDTPRGIVVGVFVTPPVTNPTLQGAALSLENTFVPATKTRGYYVLVVDDPYVVFEIMDDGLAALTSTACNKNASYTVAAPSGISQQSGTVLNTSSVATTNSLPIRLMGLKLDPVNAYGVNARWLGKFNQHELTFGTVGV